MDVLAKSNVPFVKVQGQEADDVVATLAQQALTEGYKVVIASPDKDFNQLISDDVQIVQPIIKCIVGDEVDGVPGLQSVVPSFGRKTALKLLKKRGLLENLLNAAAVRTVGKPYVQDALIQHADYLRKNYQVLSLKKDVDVLLQDDWLVQRDQCHDSGVLADFFKVLAQKHSSQVLLAQKRRGCSRNKCMLKVGVSLLEMIMCLAIAVQEILVITRILSSDKVCTTAFPAKNPFLSGLYAANPIPSYPWKRSRKFYVISNLGRTDWPMMLIVQINVVYYKLLKATCTSIYVRIQAFHQLKTHYRQLRTVQF
ncbi:5'-3' exonuclease [Linum perenne]